MRVTIIPRIPKYGSFVVISAAWTPTYKKKHQITVKIDEDWTIFETNKLNNNNERDIYVYPNLPDFTITDISYSDSTPFDGQQILVNANIANIGGKDSSTDVSFYVDDIYKGEIPVSIAERNGNSIVSLPIVFTSPGNHNVKVIADEAGLVPEDDEGNNQITSSITVHSPLPDLHARDISLDITTPVVGDTVHITGVFSNDGEISANNVDVDLTINGIVVKEINIHVLDESSTKTIDYEWSPSHSGYFEVKLETDPHDTIVESNNGNNVRTETYYVYPEQPDFTPTDIKFSDNTPYTGQEVIVSADIANIGGKDSPTDVSFFVEDILKGTVTIFVPGKKGHSTASLPIVFTSPGKPVVKVIADAAGLIAEADETNNQKTRSITVHTPLPDLDANDIHLDISTPVVGDSVLVTGVFSNDGEILAENAVAHLMINGIIEETTTLDIEASSTKNLIHTWIPTSSGNFEIKLVTDPEDKIVESNDNKDISSNNVRTETFYVYPDKPDFIPTEIKLSDDSPYDGQEVIVSADIANIGGKDGSTDVSFYVDSTFKGTVPVIVPGKNGHTIVSLPVVFTSTGWQQVKVIVDEANLVPEADDGNNEVDRWTYVHLPLADLKADEISFNIRYPVIGDSVLITGVFSNRGEKLAENVVAELYIEDLLVKEGTIGSMGADSSESISSTWTPDHSGYFKFKLVIDPHNDVIESDDKNNVIVRTYYVYSRVMDTDLQIHSEDISFSKSNSIIDEDTLISANIANVGTDMATDVNVKFYIDNILIDTKTIPSIPGKFSDTVTSNWIAKGQGSHVVKIETGIDGFETNLTNNIATRGLIVLKEPITSIKITPSALTITVTNTQLFTATDQNDNQISVDWRSSDENVGTVFPSTGTATIFTALTGGTTTVTATSGGVVGSAEVTSVWEDFTFVHLTDVHIGSLFQNPYQMLPSVEKFTDTLETIKRKNPSAELILITGDLTDDRTKDFFKAFANVLKSINIPVKTTPGNHDRRLGLFFNDLSNYNSIINNPINYYTIPTPINPSGNDYAFDFKGYRFIGLDSGADYNTGSQEIAEGLLGLDLGPESEGLNDFQIGEFNNNAPKIIFMHHPIISSQDDFWGEDVTDVLFNHPIPNDCLDKDGKKIGGNDNTIGNNRCNFINYAKDNNVQLVLTGHSHMDAIFTKTGDELPPNENSIDRPLFIQTRSADQGYRVIEVKNGIASPKEIVSTPKFVIRKSSDLWIKYIPADINSWKISGLHAYDSQKRHTGMIACTGDFELGIPDSYYTGNYGVYTPTPEVIVGYTPDIDITKGITEFRTIFGNVCSSEPLVSNAKITGSSENIIFDQTIEDQTEKSTTKVNFFNVTIPATSNASVNVSDGVNYIMDVDINGDGITDLTILPESISTNLFTPQNNIEIITYNGTGKINISSSSGNITTASSLNPSSLPNKPSSEFPFGVLAFNISDLSNGQTVDVTITLPQNLPADTVYWKYGQTPDDPTPHWYTIPLGSNDGDNVITIQLKDGGFGDDDLMENGIIVDAGGPGVPIEVTSIASVENLQASTGTNWLNFTWTNPPDPDYHHVMLYLNGSFKTSILVPQNYYNFTGLDPDSLYELGTHTVDTSGKYQPDMV